MTSSDNFFSTLAIQRLVKKYASGAPIAEEAIAEIKRLLEETGKALVIEARTYTAASKRVKITDADVKNARAHVLKN